MEVLFLFKYGQDTQKIPMQLDLKALYDKQSKNSRLHRSFLKTKFSHRQIISFRVGSFIKAYNLCCISKIVSI
jgi:hypothetical protein